MGRYDDLRAYLDEHYVEDVFGRQLLARERAAQEWAEREAAREGAEEAIAGAAAREYAADTAAIMPSYAGASSASFAMPAAAEPKRRFGLPRIFRKEEAQREREDASAAGFERAYAPEEEEPASAAMYGEAPAEAAPAAAAAAGLTAAAPTAQDLTHLLDALDAPFSPALLALIDARGFTDAQVYKRANLSRQHFAKIRADADYQPTKRTVLALSIALELSLAETQDLLSRAGFTLSTASKADLIVRFFIEHGVYDIFTINEALYAFDQPVMM